MLAKLESAVSASRAPGMVADFESHHNRPLVEHLADFARSLADRGASAKHAAQVVGRARKVVHGCGFNFIRELSLSRVESFLAELRDEGAFPDLPPPPPPKPGEEPGYTKGQLAAALNAKETTIAAIVKRHGLKATGNGKARRFPCATAEAVRDWLRRGRGSQTVAHYAAAVRQFVRWLVRDQRTPANPLASLSTAHGEADIRRDRRAATHDEMRAAIVAANSSKQVFRGLTGPQRAAASSRWRASQASGRPSWRR